jgi:hypothetical protein
MFMFFHAFALAMGLLGGMSGYPAHSDFGSGQFVAAPNDTGGTMPTDTGGTMPTP